LIGRANKEGFSLNSPKENHIRWNHEIVDILRQSVDDNQFWFSV